MEQKDFDPATTHAWLMNLLPEENALRLVGATLEVDDYDVFAMLETMGGDLAGALQIGPHNVVPAKMPGYRKLTDEELYDCLKRLPDRPLLVGEDGVHMSAAGAQDKLPVGKYKDGTYALPLNGAASTYIIKPTSKRFRDSVQNEGCRPGRRDDEGRTCEGH
jgi:serine/threonine-protein kinase HipA